MTETVDEGAERTAWFSAMTATGLVAVGMVFELLGGRRLPAIPNWPAFLSMGVSTTLFIVLGAFRHRKSLRVASAVIIVNSAAMAFALFIRDPYFAAHGNWFPFQANKAACIAVALLAPQLWSGLVAIALHTASALSVLVSVGPELRERIVFEPIGTLAFAFVAVGLLLYRRRRHSLERAVAAARAELLAAERLARALLAVRDLANTPIQTLEVCCEILRMRSNLEPDVVARMQRALDRLHELSELLRKHEAAVRWRKEDASIDAITQLERSLTPQLKASARSATAGA